MARSHAPTRGQIESETRRQPLGKGNAYGEKPDTASQVQKYHDADKSVDALLRMTGAGIMLYGRSASLEKPCHDRLLVATQHNTAAVRDRSIHYTRVRTRNDASHSQAPHVCALRWCFRQGSCAGRNGRAVTWCTCGAPAVVFAASPPPAIVH